MKKIIIKLLFVFAFLLPTLGTHSAISAESFLANEEKIAATLKAHSRITQLIVGCGKTPYGWTPQAEGGKNMWSNDMDKGNHNHLNCLTLAETEEVEPTILWDWTKPVPLCMHNRFTFIYLEKLPPKVLEQDICMQNLYACLMPGKKGIFDYQVYNICGEDYSIQNPFCISVPPVSLDTRNQINKLQGSFDKAQAEFLTIADLKKDASIDPGQFQILLESNPKLYQLQVSMCQTQQEINEIQNGIFNTQLIGIRNHREKMYEKAKENLRASGFEKVTIKENTPNPYNQRKNSTLMWGTKK